MFPKVSWWIKVSGGAVLLSFAALALLRNPYDLVPFYFFGVPGTFLIHVALASWISGHFFNSYGDWLDLELDRLTVLSDPDHGYLPSPAQKRLSSLISLARVLSNMAGSAFCVAGFSVGWVVFDPLERAAPIFAFVVYPFMGYLMTGMVVGLSGVIFSVIGDFRLGYLGVPFATTVCIVISVLCFLVMWLPLS